MKHCNRCGRDLPFGCFYKDKETGEPKAECKECRKGRTMDRYHQKRDHCLGVRRVYQQRNRQHIRERDKASRFARKLEVFGHYGGAFCQCCGETCVDMLSLDHINQDGAEHRRSLKKEIGGVAGGHFIYAWARRNNFPPMFQVLCMNCNRGRYYNSGICPHESDRQELLKEVSTAQTKRHNGTPSRESLEGE